MQASSFSGLDRAASTAATERGRPTPSGTTVSGKSVRFCRARTAISKGSADAFAEKRRSSGGVALGSGGEGTTEDCSTGDCLAGDFSTGSLFSEDFAIVINRGLFSAVQ